MAHELWLLRGNQMTDISILVGDIGRRSNMDELGEEITFNMAHSESKLFPKTQCQVGDMVILMNNGKELTRAIITNEQRFGRDAISYSAYDFAFYLNKSSAIYQFNKMRADQAIRKVLRDFNIPIGNVVSIPYAVDKIFNDVVVSDIIREILELAEQTLKTKYRMEMRAGKLYIEHRTDNVVRAWFNLRNNGFEYDAAQALSNPTKSLSIVDMVNSVQVVSNDDKLLLTRSDQPMVRKYGRLQKVVKLDQKEKLSAAQIAKNELDELSRVTETASVEMLGDDNVRAGRLIDIEEPITKIKGRYLIKSVDHTISGGHHRMSLDLEVQR